jgi:ribonuclease P protein component
MVLWVAPSGSETARVGVVASRRTFHRAHERNRAKRLLREAFRLQALGFVPGVDMVLVARRRILEVKRQAVDVELSTLGARLKVMVNA